MNSKERKWGTCDVISKALHIKYVFAFFSRVRELLNKIIYSFAKHSVFLSLTFNLLLIQGRDLREEVYLDAVNSILICGEYPPLFSNDELDGLLQVGNTELYTFDHISYNLDINTTNYSNIPMTIMMVFSWSLHVLIFLYLGMFLFTKICECIHSHVNNSAEIEYLRFSASCSRTTVSV